MLLSMANTFSVFFYSNKQLPWTDKYIRKSRHYYFLHKQNKHGPANLETEIKSRDIIILPFPIPWSKYSTTSIRGPLRQIRTEVCGDHPGVKQLHDRGEANTPRYLVLIYRCPS